MRIGLTNRDPSTRAARTTLISRMLVQKSFIWPLSVVIAVPIALILTVDNWAFTGLGWLDAWSYVGYAYHYLDPTYNNDYYKVSRVPWILYEFTFRHLFEPVAATYIIQFTCLAGSATAVFLTCRLLKFGDTASFLASSFLVTY